MASEHISDHDLERYCLRMVTKEEALAPLEEHLLCCHGCIDRAERTNDYIDLIRRTLIDKTRTDLLNREKGRNMAKCVHCGEETELWDAGIPKCIACSDARDPAKTKLRDRAKPPANDYENQVEYKPLDDLPRR